MEDYIHSETDMFVGPDMKVGRTHLMKHHINIHRRARPVKQMSHRLPCKKEAFVELEVQHLKDEDMIEDADGPWASSVVIAKKNDGDDRLCIDYLIVNDVTEKRCSSSPTY